MEYVLHAIGVPSWKAKKALRPVTALLWHLHDQFIPHHRNNYHPHILGPRVLALSSVLLVSLKIFSLALLSFGPVVPAFSSAITPSNIISLTNQSRQEFGLPQLEENFLLARAAQAKATDMLERGYFSHNTPDGNTPWSFIEQAGYNYLMAGENLAVNFLEAESVEQAWMNSPGHKANIVNPDFEEIGIGIASGIYQGHQATFVVQMFGTAAEQKITISNTPTELVSRPEDQAAKNLSSSAPAAGEPAGRDLSSALEITGGEAVVAAGSLKVAAHASPQAVKVLARFGSKGVMLQPKPEGLWEGELPVASLPENYTYAKIVAYDINGNTKEFRLADFSKKLTENFSVLGVADSQDKVSWLGRTFNPKDFESKFYLTFTAAILACMVLAIGIRRHIQHLSLVANSSFVAMLAVLLWLGT